MDELVEGIDKSQFGFRNRLGTRKALFALNVLAQRCMDINIDIHVCYVDFEKAFDKVRHEKLVQILQAKNYWQRRPKNNNKSLLESTRTNNS